jgi:hypothetical protein
MTISLMPHFLLFAYDAKRKKLRQFYSNMPLFSSCAGVIYNLQVMTLCCFPCCDVHQEEQE